jgi:hypothetical protein
VRPDLPARQAATRGPSDYTPVRIAERAEHRPPAAFGCPQGKALSGDGYLRPRASANRAKVCLMSRSLIPLALAAFPLFACHKAGPPNAERAPAIASASSSEPQSAPPPATAITGPKVSTLEGGACSGDADCGAYLHCCGAMYICGTAEDEKRHEAFCACCVSCPAPARPPKPIHCVCVASRCTAS